MYTVLTLDTMAKRYSLLPTEVLARATTYDLYIMDAAVSYHNYQMEKASNGGKEPIPDYTEEQLLSMIAQTKHEN